MVITWYTYIFNFPSNWKFRFPSNKSSITLTTEVKYSRNATWQNNCVDKMFTPFETTRLTAGQIGSVQSSLKSRKWFVEILLSRINFLDLNRSVKEGRGEHFGKSSKDDGEMDYSNCDWESVWPDWVIYWTLGNFLKHLATINLPKFSTFLGNFCKGFKIYHF